jgi:hypothetical protein
MAIRVPTLEKTYHVPGIAPVTVPIPYVRLTGYMCEWRQGPAHQLLPPPGPDDQPRTADDGVVRIPGTGDVRLFVAAANFEGFLSRDAARDQAPVTDAPQQITLVGKDALSLIARAESPGGSIRREWYAELHRQVAKARALRDAVMAVQPNAKTLPNLHPFDGAEPIMEG